MTAHVPRPESIPVRDAAPADPGFAPPPDEDGDDGLGPWLHSADGGLELSAWPTGSGAARACGIRRWFSPATASTPCDATVTAACK